MGREQLVQPISNAMSFCMTGFLVSSLSVGPVAPGAKVPHLQGDQQSAGNSVACQQQYKPTTRPVLICSQTVRSTGQMISLQDFTYIWELENSIACRRATEKETREDHGGHYMRTHGCSSIPIVTKQPPKANPRERRVSEKVKFLKMRLPSASPPDTKSAQSNAPPGAS